MEDRQIRLLLVDDEAELNEYLSKRFSRDGFMVASFTCGPDALKAAETQAFDMAVVDLKMPLMDGVEVLQRLKKLQPFVQVVVLTGYGSLETALQSGRSQAYRYLEKPYEFDRLRQILLEAHDHRRLLQREQFQREMAALTAENRTSSTELLASIEQLRAKYEQE